MALELYMVGVVTQDLRRSLEFYQRLGLALPEVKEDQRFVPVKMESGITFFLNNSARPLNNPAHPQADQRSQVIFEFYLPDRASVDKKYAELTDSGYQSSRAPAFDQSIPVY